MNTTMIQMKGGTESNQVIIIIIIQRALPDNADGNVEMQENNDANQQHIDDAIDEEENGHEEQLNDNANVTLSKMLPSKLQWGREVEIMVAGECGPDVVTTRVHDHNGERTMSRIRRTMCTSILHRTYAHRKGVERMHCFFFCIVIRWMNMKLWIRSWST